MPVANMNKIGIDLPEWDQLVFAPATGIAGTNIVDDNKRYIYTYFQTSATAAQFWRYDTWGDGWQQLATPATQTGTVANMLYTEGVGGQWSGRKARTGRNPLGCNPFRLGQRLRHRRHPLYADDPDQARLGGAVP